jgi:hypothetical protein
MMHSIAVSIGSWMLSRAGWSAVKMRRRAVHRDGRLMCGVSSQGEKLKVEMRLMAA